MCGSALQAKYEHAVAAAQKSISQHSDTSDDEEEGAEEEEDDNEDGNGSRNKKIKQDSLSAAEKVQQAAELVEAVLKAQRKLQQLQASSCYCHHLHSVSPGYTQRGTSTQAFYPVHVSAHTKLGPNLDEQENHER